ncbi:MAG TPA: hypothetical protein EYM84_10815 [Flavobacteriales bacterium]|nr:hypothetical protein [Flavobacteriales bacterium]
MRFIFRFYKSLPICCIWLFVIGLFVASCNLENDVLRNYSNIPLMRASNKSISFKDLSHSNIAEAVAVSIRNALEALDKIKQIENPNFDNVIRAYDKVYNSLNRIILPLDLIIEVDPREVVRVAAKTGQAKLKDFLYGLAIDEDLYNVIKGFSETREAQDLTGPKKKYLDDLMLSYIKAGFNLGEEKREEIKGLKSHIDKLGKEYGTNMAAASSDYIEITEDQTGGLDSSYLIARKTEKGTYKIDVSYPSVRPFLKYSTSDSLRKELNTIFYNRAAPRNVVLLDSILYLRQHLASLLGYDTYADYNFSSNMAKTKKTVWDFENSLREKVLIKGNLDRQELLRIKSNYLNEKASTIESWESKFYTQILKEKEYQLDEREVKNYFEQNAVLEGLFLITQKLLGLKYEEIDSPNVWHPDVRMFKCFDVASDKWIGSFYLDLYPRENKYSHAAMFSITAGMAKNNNEFEMPEAALVCNFSKPVGDQPSLMSHSEVETFFHEFGHLLHGMVTKAEFSYQSGPEEVVIDFVEAPSQIYENWAWNKETLSLFAKHYKTGEIIPDDLLEKMLSVKNLNSGLSALGQIFYGTYALTIHDTYMPYGDENTTQIGYKLRKEILGNDYPEDTHFEASFGHLIGYKAGYYSYMWSKVYAQDMWSVFEKEGVLNPELGMRYRKLILEPGDSKDALDMVKEFLGREPNDKALLKDLGLDLIE